MTTGIKVQVQVMSTDKIRSMLPYCPGYTQKSVSDETD